MLLIDFSSMAVATLANIQSNPATRSPFDMQLVRKVVLGRLRDIRAKFKANGLADVTVLACDSKGSWRKDYFKCYKIRRSEKLPIAGITREEMHAALNDMKEELRESFPVKVISVDRCEADDIIAVLARTAPSNEQVVIVSADQDFLQLQTKPNIRQWDQTKGKFITVSGDWRTHLKEKILCGDSGDDVPSVLSEDTVFVCGVRQKPMRKALLESLMNTPEDQYDEETRKRFERNKMCIDLGCIPAEYTSAIIDAYEKETPQTGKVWSYLFKHNLSLLRQDPYGLT